MPGARRQAPLAIGSRGRRTADCSVHDFAGCSVEEILAAVGLDFNVIIPRARGRPSSAWRRRNRTEFVTSWLRLTSSFMSRRSSVCDVATGKSLSDEDRTGAQLAARRIVKFITELNNAR